MLSWVRVGASWCVLGASWGVLGVSYRRLRPDLGTSWGYFLIVLVDASGAFGFSGLDIGALQGSVELNTLRRCSLVNRAKRH